MKKVLITGGAGFIGSFICRELIKQGHKPIIVDIFAQYNSPFKQQEIRKQRFKGIEDKVIIERANVSNYSIMREIILRHKPEYIIHLASLPIAKIPNIDIDEMKEGTIDATTNIINIIKDFKFVKKFIYTSSSMVYGNFKFKEVLEISPTNPINIYGIMKLAGEVITEGMCKLYNINYNIIRPSAVYGPTDMNKRVTQIFIENAKKGKDLIVKGNLKLDFTYVEDTAIGFVLALFSKYNGIFNITRGEARTIEEFAMEVQKYFKVKIKKGKVEKNIAKRGKLNISKAKWLLNYKPKYNIERGIKKYIK